ncbi:MAG: prohibitin family protein [Rhodocyclaceae bacterium]|nr:prohibitin family protein [Rhodocyclaceae bacterium]
MAVTLPVAGGFRWLNKIAMVVGTIVVLWLLAPIAIVPAGHRGVMTTFGAPQETVHGEGLHFRLPIAQKMHLVDVRIQKGEGKGDAASKDLQHVETVVALNYHIDPAKVVEVFSNIGVDDGGQAGVGSKIILPAVQEGVKAVTAQFTSEELISKRSEVRERIKALLVERLSRHGVAVDEFSIVNFAFSRAFADSIEAKARAEQEKLKAERDLQRIRVEAEQKIAQARAEAEALSIQKAQVTPELIRLREIENQKEAIKKWDGRLPNVTGGAVPFINVEKR